MDTVFEYQDITSGLKLGNVFSCVWNVDDDYDAFEVDAGLWLNVAADIAHEVGANDDGS